MSTSNKNEDSHVFSQEAIVNAIAEFNYMTEKEVIFLSYFSRYENLYTMDYTYRSDHKKSY